MSEKFTGITFAKQKVTPSDDAIVRRAILPDGILTGCELSYSGSTLTMAAGHLMICGRQIRMPSVQNWAVVDATSGFARLVMTIDLTRTATKETFEQVLDSIEYASAEDGFTELEQMDINLSGTRYQVAACVVSLGTGGITGIVSKLEKCEVGAGLNFKVVGGVTQPSNPSENTIWVKTDQKITGWTFASEAPNEPEEGHVWISVGTSGSVDFNALKKNCIQVCLVSVKQYIDGTWVEKDTEIYQGVEWGELWKGELFKSGDTFEHITGGWQASNSTGDTGSFDILENGVISVNADEANVWAHTKDPIDITDFNYLRAEIDYVNVGGTLSIAVLPEGSSFSANSYVARTVITEIGLVSLDISSLAGKYHVAIGAHNNTNDYGRADTKEVYLEQ